MIEENKRSDNMALILLVFMVILSTSFFRFSFFYSNATTKLISIILELLLIVNISKNYYELDTTQMRFSKGILILFLLSLLSAIPSFLIFEQSIFDSLRTSFYTMGFFIPYWYLHANQIEETTVLKVLGISAIILVVIQIYQQLFPGMAMWGLLGEDDEEAWETLERSMRNDLYRFRIGFNGVFTLPILFYAWEKITTKVTTKHVIIFSLMCVSIYLNLTRQLMFSTIVVLIISLFIMKNQSKFTLTIIVTLIGLFFIQYASYLFGDLLADASSQANDESYVRYLSFAYYFENSYDSILSALCGHGLPAGSSTYAALREALHTSNINASDVGFVGAFYNWGYIHVIIFFYFIYIIFKNRYFLPTYIFLYFIAITITSVMIWPILGVSSILVLSLMLYLCDLHLNNPENCYLEQDYE